MNPVIEKALRLAEASGASYAEARLTTTTTEVIEAEDGSIKEVSRNTVKGLGIRVFVGTSSGFAATSDLSEDSIRSAVEAAIAAARAVGGGSPLAERRVWKGRATSRLVVDPFEVDFREKVELVLEANKAALGVGGVKSSLTYLGIRREVREIGASDGADVIVDVTMTGLVQSVSAAEGASLERASDSDSAVAGWEFMEGRDWASFSRSVAELAVKALHAEVPKAGKYRVVADPRLIGLILHEAFGHALEGDLVSSGAYVLTGKIGETVASELVTVIDDGVVEGGYFVPFDDEGNRKEKVVAVEKGILKSYLTGRRQAAELGQAVTGNARAQDYASAPIVRQTNIFIEPGDWGFEEMIRELGNGLYLLGRSARGGQVDTASGTFTFSVGPSWVVESGEIKKMIKGVVVSGQVLETLKAVEAVGKDLRVRTSVFGGCGKEAQTVKVGLGGPHVLIKEIVVGGR